MKQLLEKWNRFLNEEQSADINTVGDLRKALKATLIKKRGGKIADAATDIAVGAILDMLPGAGTAKNIFDLAKAAYNAPDDKKTNTALDRLNVDDEVSAIVDDTIEDAFLKIFAKELEDYPDEMSIKLIDVTRMLNNYIQRQYDKRKVALPKETEE